MRVLYLEHPTPDLLAAVLYKGLCEEIGPENVVDHPWKAIYHGVAYEGEGSVHHQFPWLPVVTAWQRSDEVIAESIGGFDLVVLASPRPDNTAALQRLIDRVGRSALRKLALVDGEDYTATRWDLIERFRPDVYFKLSMVPSPFEVWATEKARVEGSVRVVPFPLACPTAPMAPEPKTIDVAFLGGNYWRPAALRREGVVWTGPSEREYKAALDARLSREFRSYLGSVKERPIPHGEFMSLLNRSRIAICVGGHGIEPMRTYEILACHETMLVRERIPVIAPHPLVEGVHCAMFDTKDGFDHEEVVHVVRRHLDDEDRRVRIAKAGNALLRERYTPRARARQLLSESL